MGQQKNRTRGSEKMGEDDGTGKHRLDISYVWKVHGASAGGYIPLLTIVGAAL